MKTFSSFFLTTICIIKCLGPDGTGNYQPKELDYCHYIGSKSSPVEGSSDAKYLWRHAPSNPPPWMHKHWFVGEIGWRTKEFGSLNQTGFLQGKKIMPKLNLPAEEYEIINEYKNPRKLTFNPHY